MDGYEKLLAKARRELPAQTQKDDRFVIEKIRGHIEGSKTVIINLKQIAKTVRRDPEHLLKYLLRELATPGKMRGERTMFGSKVAASTINKKIAKYASEFVYCSECNKPDTELVEEKGIHYLKCQACGAKKPVKRI
jgi:translation initiation factor 2 subunit 2